jgi:hypothetical protein
MASRRRSTQLLGSLIAGAALLSCAHAERRFPLREPISKDTDLRPVRVQCRHDRASKDPALVSCAPEVSFSPLIWDGADNLFFRPLTESLGVVTSGEAVNVNSMDEVPDSSWFQNRIGVRAMTTEEFALGDCEPGQLIDPERFADGSWIIDKGKEGGQTDGFRVVIPGKGKFLFKAEDNADSEHSSAAQTVGAAVYHAAGFYTTCEQVVYFKPSLLHLNPGLHWKHNFGDTEDFDARALEKVIAHCPQRDGLVRMQASEWLPGYSIGPFFYEGTRRDDPNDVIPHEDRRELRGVRVLNAWIDRFDARSGNTLDMWYSEKGQRPDGSPGYVLHHQMDTSEALGSEWSNMEAITRRLGYSYVLDWGDLAQDFFTLGIPLRVWDINQRVPGKEMFVFFNVRDFVPDQWKNEYPVTSFSRMTERDGAWMARILARFTPEQVHALAALPHYSDPSNTLYLEQMLAGRLAKVLDRYLTRVSSVTEVHVEGTDRICGVDLAELRGVRGPEVFQYHARRVDGPWLTGVDRHPGAIVCVTVPHVAPDGGLPDASPERYVKIRIQDGVAPGPLVAHLYDLGPVRGYRLVGLERPDR